jgi:hypothetical protein
MSDLSQILESAKEANTAANKERLISPELIQKTRALRASAGTGIHHAFCIADAPDDNKINCYLDATGEEIIVHCNISGGVFLSMAWRHLADGDRLEVAKIDDEWTALEGFQNVYVCPPEE